MNCRTDVETTFTENDSRAGCATPSLEDGSSSCATAERPERFGLSPRRLRVLAIGHTYMLRANQQKWLAMMRRLPVDVAVLAPKAWPAPVWGRTFHFERPETPLAGYDRPAWFAGRLGGHLYSPLSFARIVRRFRPDLIQVEQESFSLAAFEAAVIARVFQIPLSVFCWENVDRPLGMLRRWSRRFVLDRAGLMIAGGQTTADTLRRWGHRGRLAVIPQLGVDAGVSVPASNRPPDTPLRVGFVGRLVNAKGVDVLLNASAKLLRGGTHMRLLVCGSGPDSEELQRTSTALGVQDAIRWYGAVPHEQVPEFLDEVDVLVLPSRSVSGWREQFGHVLIEAMSKGLPVVGSDCGEIPNVIGRHDLIFPENDAGALSEILQKLSRDPSFYREASCHSFQRVRSRFTHERVAEACWSAWLDAFPALARQLPNEAAGRQECQP